MSRAILSALVLGLASLGLTIPAWAKEVTCQVETDQRQYTSGDLASVDVVCDNRTDGEVVIVGRSVEYVGLVFGKDRLWKWDGGYVGSFGAYDDFGNDWIRFKNSTPVPTEIHIPARSKVVIATLWGAPGQFGWHTDQIGTGQPLSPGDYLIEVVIDEIRTSLGTLHNVQLLAPVKIVQRVAQKI